MIRKPLILYGAKQIGKTYSALEFGKKEYKNIVYFNTENNKAILDVFQKERSVEKIILNLSLLSIKSTPIDFNALSTLLKSTSSPSTSEILICLGLI